MKLSRTLRGASPVALALAMLGAPRAIFAAPRVDKKACIASSESGQKLQHDGKLRAAREQLAICARPECPAVIRQDCNDFLNQVTGSMPSVVIAARDSSGKETLNVKVTIDGEVALTKLDGKSLTLDPGVHAFKYESEDGLSVQDEVGVREGEKNRVLYVSFRKSEPAATPAAAPTTPAPADSAPAAHPASARPASRGGIPTGAYVFGGIGLVGVGLGTLLLVTADNDASNLRSTCAPSCSHSDVSAARNKALLGDVGIAVGGVALVAAVWMVLARPAADKPATTGALRFGLAPTPGGAAAAASGMF